MRLRLRLFLTLACVPAILAGCSAATEPATKPSNETSGENARAAQQAAPGAPIMFDTLAVADISDADLAGRRGCRFLFSAGDDPLLSGTSVAGSDSVAALVKVDGAVVRLAQVGGGGYDAMAAGSHFAAGDLSATVDVTGDHPMAHQSEQAAQSPVRTARLTIERGGRKLAIDGFWQCDS